MEISQAMEISQSTMKRTNDVLTPSDGEPADKSSKIDVERDHTALSSSELFDKIRQLTSELEAVKEKLASVEDQLTTAKDIISKNQTLIHNQREQISSQLSELAHSNSERGQLKQDLDFVKIKLADKVIEHLRQPAQLTYAAAAAAKPKSVPATLVVTLEPNATVPDQAKIEQILGSRHNGPVAQSVRHVNNKMFLKFGNTEALKKAQSLLQSKPEAKQVFCSTEVAPRLFPVLVLNVNQTKFPTGDSLVEDLNKVSGNKLIHGHVKKIILFKSNPNSSFSTAKLLIDSREIRDNLITRGRLFSSSSDSFQVVAVDPNKEVCRCYKCQHYGHRASKCRSQQTRCGKCAGPHVTKECNNTNRCCVNCGEAHHSGSLSCRVQLAEVERYISLFC